MHSQGRRGPSAPGAPPARLVNLPRPIEPVIASGPLSDRELIHAIARGHSSRQIAALQQLRCDTVRRQLSDLYRRLGVRDHHGLIAWGLQQGLLRSRGLVTS